MNIVERSVEFGFGGKAETLERISRSLQSGSVLPLFHFKVSKYLADPAFILEEIRLRFGDAPLIVRSSSHAEDLDSGSQAGKFVSILNVQFGRSLDEAIASVIRSYGKPNAGDAILVQPMAVGVLASGVAMTCDPQTGLPYDVVEYTNGNDTDGVTAGNTGVKTFVALKGPDVRAPELLAGLFPMLRELERITGREAIDVEFAVTRDGPLLFQVRPMTAVTTPRSLGEGASPFQELVRSECRRASDYIGRHAPTKTGLPQNAWFGLMPDWNPAEMIGVKPRPLAYSLYRNLITDMNWASARFRYGYRDMRAYPLMIQLGGAPYIRIPYSLESLIPASVPEAIAQCTIAACGSHIAANPELHDKIEFSVIPTCFTPTLSQSEARSVPAFAGLTGPEQEIYLEGLRTLTERMIDRRGPFTSDLKLAAQIEQKLRALRSRTDPMDPQHEFRMALSEAKIVAEVFAGTARAAFVATAILKSMQALGELHSGFTDALIGSTNTIGRQMSDDFRLLSKEGFLARHGHVRPGTYDIRVPSYEEEPDSYFDWLSPVARSTEMNVQMVPDRTTIGAIQRSLQKCEMQISGSQFLEFAIAAISARENFKYLYAAFVSEALKSLSRWGADRGISRDGLSFLPIESIARIADGEDHISDLISSERSRWLEMQNVRVPMLICDQTDLLSHSVQVSRPNFITRCIAKAPARFISAQNGATHELKNHIVLIENADPGYDWIFTHEIAGFITAYGGENSHMSIRAREFGVPAAIGVGAERFSDLSKARHLSLDCSEQRIEIVV